MRVIIILAAIAFTHGAKLERTYLPPSNARTAGGSGNFLQTPVSGVSGIPGSASPARNSYQNAQSGNDFSQSGNGFSQSGNGYGQLAQYDGVNFNNFANEARPERPQAALERNAAILRQDSSNDGETFSYAFETENGIYAEQSGVATNGVEAQGGYSYTGDDGQVYSIRYTANQNGFVPQGDHLPTPPPVPEEILKALEQNARDEAAGIYDDGSYADGKYAAAGNNNYNDYNSNAFNGNDDTVTTNSALTRPGSAPAYNAPKNGPTYNAANGAIAATYGVPNAPNRPTYNAANGAITATYGVPNAPNRSTYNAANGATAATYGAPNAANNRNVPSYNVANIGVARNSAVNKAYLPPSADQGQVRNTFGRRQQSFNARTGYQY